MQDEVKNQMIKYIINRLLLLILVILGVLLLVFILSRSSGDPIPGLLGDNYTQEQYDAMYVQLGFDKPYIIQYFEYVWGVFTRLDLGNSLTSGKPVIEEVLGRFPISIRLSLNAVIWSVPIGILFGILSAVKRYSSLDYIVTTASMVMASMPGFWVALMLMLIFSLRLGLMPATGLDSWKGYILPAITMGLHPVAYITRMTRTTMLEVIRQDYIRTARSKGLNERKVIWDHALQNAMVPIVTQIGNQITISVGGSAVVENIFLIPGLGSFLIYSIQMHDFPSVQGTVVAYAVFVSLINLTVDIIYGFIDPRIKAKYMSASRTARKMSRNMSKIAEERA